MICHDITVRSMLKHGATTMPYQHIFIDREAEYTEVGCKLSHDGCLRSSYCATVKLQVDCALLC